MAVKKVSRPPRVFSTPSGRKYIIIRGKRLYIKAKNPKSRKSIKILINNVNKMTKPSRRRYRRKNQKVANMRKPLIDSLTSSISSYNSLPSPPSALISSIRDNYEKLLDFNKLAPAIGAPDNKNLALEAKVQELQQKQVGQLEQKISELTNDLKSSMQDNYNLIHKGKEYISDIHQQALEEKVGFDKSINEKSVLIEAEREKLAQLNESKTADEMRLVQLHEKETERLQEEKERLAKEKQEFLNVNQGLLNENMSAKKDKDKLEKEFAENKSKQKSKELYDELNYIPAQDLREAYNIVNQATFEYSKEVILGKVRGDDSQIQKILDANIKRNKEIEKIESLTNEDLGKISSTLEFKNLRNNDDMMRLYNQYMLEPRKIATLMKYVNNPNLITPLASIKNMDKDNLVSAAVKIGRKDLKTKANVVDEATSDKKFRQKLIEHFANQEGTGLKGNGLYDYELEEIMAPYKARGFKGVISADQIDKIVPKSNKIGFIMNTDKAIGPGKHWVACYIDTKNDNSLEYYDSFANPPSKLFMRDIKKLIEKMKPETYLKYKVNKIKEQSVTSPNCGWFAASFLIDRFDGVPFKECTPFSKVKQGETRIKLMKKKFGLI